MSQAYLYSKVTWGHAHTHSFVRTKGRMRACFLQSRESVCVSPSFLPVSSSCLLLSHHCLCQCVCYMWLCLCIHFFFHPLYVHKMYYVNVLYFYSVYNVSCVLSVCLSEVKTDNSTRVLSTSKQPASRPSAIHWVLVKIVCQRKKSVIYLL